MQAIQRVDAFEKGNCRLKAHREARMLHANIPQFLKLREGSSTLASCDTVVNASFFFCRVSGHYDLSTQVSCSTLADRQVTTPNIPLRGNA